MERGERKKMKSFITFEGIDGSGKSTISKLVFKKLKSEGYDIVYTFEPTNTFLGKYVQKCIETKTDPYITAFAFIADRFEHCKKIIKWLVEGKIVLCDRYAESTYAYQAAQMEEEVKNPIKWLKELSQDRIIVPDRTYLFLINPKDAIARITNRESLIPFEKEAFLEKVNNNYVKLAIGKRFKKLDATKSIDELVEICVTDILK